MSTELEKIIEALSFIDPSTLDYQEWTNVGMALKAADLPCYIWEDWSSRDTYRYHIGECEKKWDTFTSSGVTIASIYHMAQERGYKPHRLDWDSKVIWHGDVDDVIAQHIDSKELEPYEMAIQYLETLFNPDEFVSFVTQAVYKEDRDKWIPANAGTSLKCSTIINNLKKYKRFDEAFGTINSEAGAWIRFNPTDGQGATNNNVTRFTYALVESDTMSIEDQKKTIVRLNLPVAALVESGSKSIHAIVRVDAKDAQEYKQRVALLYDELGKHGFAIDSQNKNCARLSRLAGAPRKGNIQKLIAVNLGAKSWQEWLDCMAGINDDLPPIVSFGEMLDNPPELAPELIHGILRRGGKLLITGDSKSGKTCLAQELAVCIAEGKDWLGYKCEMGKVLYLNFEVTSAGLHQRFLYIYKEYGIPVDQAKQNLEIWNLRGRSEPLKNLSDRIIARCRDRHLTAIIFDPIYKIQSGDENSASDIGQFCNEFDRIAAETGASPIYTHHHAKGAQGDKKAIDRGSGSGVFARDPDAIIDLVTLSPDKDALAVIKATTIREDAIPMQMSFILRDFRSPQPMNMFFTFPLHIIDIEGILDDAPVEGSREANLQKSPKRTGKDERYEALVDAFESVANGNVAVFKDMLTSAMCTVSEKSLRRYLKEFPDEFSLRDGLVFRQNRDILT